MSRGQTAFYDGMIETGHPAAADINDPSQLPGIGIFPVTIDEQAKRVSTSLAYLTDEVRARNNLEIRTNAEVATVRIEDGRAKGVVLLGGEEIEADEVVVAAGAIWSPTMLLRSGVGPKDHLAEHGIKVHADLPVGSTMSDQLAAWERSAAFRALKIKPLLPHDLEAPDAIAIALERNIISYGHMVGTCPMGPVLDADCRVHGIPNLRVADASVMPTIPCGNTYLGCVMVAERIARKMKAGSRLQ